MAVTPGEARAALAILRQLRKGAYTNEPGDPNYEQHWQAQPLQPGDRIVDSYPGTAQVGRFRTPVNVRVADSQGETVYYVDTPSVERVGPLAGAAGRLLDRSGASTPRRLENGAVTVTPADEGRLRLQAPGVSVTARTDGFIGRPSELSPAQQLRQAWRFAKG